MAAVRLPRIDHRHGIREPALALTFDDGPSEWTEEILDLLAAHDAAATFFVLGSAIPGREEILRRILENGSEIGNHSYSHPRDLETLSEAEIIDEFSRTSALVEEVTRKTPRFWRAPYLNSGDRERAVLEGLGLQEVGCSVVPRDWEQPADQTVREVLAGKRPGSIVDLHDGRPQGNPPSWSAPTREETVKATARILRSLTDDGFRCVTISRLLALDRDPAPL
jgi:peptidoglycan/xylan/chitin deacetylase (PgdA/CDA1 family)